MKKVLVLAIFLLSSFMGGCTMLDSPDELTTPPKLEGDKEELRIAIKEYLPPNTKPIIPPSEDDLSYIKLIDLDGDGNEEAVVFYTLDLDENPIRILVLKKKDSVWKNKPAIKVVGQELDKVEFKDLDGDGGAEIIIGSKVKYLDKNITVYSMKDKEIETIFRDVYDDIIIDDLNGDKLAELFLLKQDREREKTQGELYKYLRGEIKLIDTISFNKDSELNYAIFDRIHKDYKGLIISTTVDENLENTYIMKMKDNKLVNLLKSGLVQNSKKLNTKPLTPRDINNDGIIEFSVPNQVQVDTEDDLINWITEWYSFDGIDNIELKALNYYDEKLNFTFEFPLKWKDKLTITNLTKNENTIKQEEYVRVEYGDNENAKKIHLFTVYIYDRDKLDMSEENPVPKDSKLILQDTNKKYYMFKNPDINETSSSIVNEEIKKIERTFRLIEK